MQTFYADLHIHVGISRQGKWVKIPTSRRLTVETIMETSRTRKGIDLVGIIDALSPWVQDDIEALLSEGRLQALAGGGYRYQGGTVLLPGAEIETSEEQGGTCHTLVYAPDLAGIRRLTSLLRPHIRNIHLSSQNAHMTFRKLLDMVASTETLVVPAHVFTPYKSLYGNCSDRMAGLIPEKEFSRVAAVELGLSADTEMADQIQELWRFPFLSNSDAHSPDRIGREYNLMRMESPNFEEFAKALQGADGRGIIANYGLDPRLGKYHRNACEACGKVMAESETGPACCGCGSRKFVCGVAERLYSISDRLAGEHPAHRADYRYHLPLAFLPGLGGKGLDKLVAAFGNEMKVLHVAPIEEVAQIAGKKAARSLQSVRSGNARVQSGGGGLYGRIISE